MFAVAHQAQLDLVLDIFYVNDTAGWHPSVECIYHLSCQPLYGLVDPVTCRSGVSFHGQKCFAHRDDDLGSIETDDCTISLHNPNIAWCRSYIW